MKNKLLLISLFILFEFGSINAFSGGGNGSLELPYEITNCTQLQEINYNLTQNYILRNDINCSDTINWNGGDGFNPIGDYGIEGDYPFSGTFDGQNYNITDLYINNNSRSFLALFGYNLYGIISNVSLVDVNFTGGNYTSGVVGINSGYVYNSSVGGTIRGSDYVGGISGFSNVEIRDSYFEGDIYGNSYVGGLAGYLGGYLRNSNATGNVHGEGFLIGGVFGYRDGIVENSFFSGNIFLPPPIEISTCQELQNINNNKFQNYILINDINCSDTLNWNGGNGFLPLGSGDAFYGYFNGDNYIIDSLYVNRPNEDNVGLFADVISSTGIYNVNMANVNINGRSYTGGIAGYIQDVYILNSSVRGEINGVSYVGGLVGEVRNGSRIEDSYSYSNVNGGDDVGGLVGVSVGEIKNSYAFGNITGTNNVGGLVGVNQEEAIRNSYSGGNVYASVNNAGGLVGYAVGSFNIENSYSRGNVSLGNDGGGGFVGTTDEIGGIIYNCYSTGHVSGIGQNYGFVGQSQGGNAENSFYDINSSGKISSGGMGEGKTIYEMKNMSTFIGSGWNFSGVWTNDSNKNNGYPYLNWQILEKDDLIPPIMGITFPLENGIYNSNGWTGITLNYDDSSICEYSLDNSSWYEFISCNDTSNFNFSDGVNQTLYVRGTDNVYNIGNATPIRFSYDNVKPTIYIIYPAITNFTNYSTNITELNYTGDGNNCWYSLDGGVTNITFSCLNNITGLASREGNNTWMIWTNDSAGNENLSSVSFVVNMPASLSETHSRGGGWKKAISGTNQTNSSQTVQITTSYSSEDNETKIPPRLFDIKLELDNSRIQNSSELSSTIRFESFGNVPTLVNLTYRILNSSGEEVYSEKGDITVTTEQILRKNFESLNLPSGKYSLILTTVYGENVTDDFRQEFFIESKSSEFGIYLLIGIISVLLIGTLIMIYSRYRVHLKYKYEDEVGGWN